MAARAHVGAGAAVGLSLSPPCAPPSRQRQQSTGLLLRPAADGRAARGVQHGRLGWQPAWWPGQREAAALEWGARFMAGSSAVGLGAMPEMVDHPPRGCWRRRLAATVMDANVGDTGRRWPQNAAVFVGDGVKSVPTSFLDGGVLANAVVRLLRAATASMGSGTTTWAVVVGMGPSFLAQRSY